MGVAPKIGAPRPVEAGVMALRRLVLLFPTTHKVMRASQLLDDAEIQHEIVPRPKGVDADCGIAIALPPGVREDATAALAEGDCEPSRVL